MNERFHLDLPSPATTQAADGMPRRLWTLAEIEAMVAAGIIDEDEHFELIGGDAVPMHPRSARHELIRAELNQHFQISAPDTARVAATTTLRLDEKTFVEPDFCEFPHSILPGDMRGYDVLLAIEIGDTSLAYDRGRKIGVYGAYGIPEVWVIDANSLVTRVHRQLGAEGYRTVFEAGSADEIAAVRAESVAMGIDHLGLKPA